MIDETAAMRRAIALSCQAVAEGGGPFGAVVVRDGVVLGEGRNRVVPDADPTAHAEVVAIRAACAVLGTHDLAGAVLYTSCEPCPMCLGAAWWARVAAVVFGNDREGAAAIGFDDAAIYAEVAAPLAARTLPIRRLLAEEARAGFDAWTAKADRVAY
ncbi:tRNA(Arg) A34 adenosine deaminase TadA [Humitalea rosea]|uniref:tRNA(Arg) A34 adenosine deaminase TadA n=1 Tax=Humitalea rosea TaxID=990373 RepID=A0A2W7IN34_9PROT|nr:nucleoside deaminase [Humitalea rosea]PZW40033.1 tRNA(Arg) A34 adenosine deaminase TadA [Humitalea rosea]